ncbi:MAG: hypothetical protein CMG74_06125 [Candidatus Marinimicrobia bacterium]|nr:hypothetical protein [Candidatus Neomarinimicrobiota bacterium]|tara:strand:- start:3627 stop:4283 length:657 start_codon:yes stop_codon:yes gene_type:complete
MKKNEFYNLKGKFYEKNDPEAIIRYHNILKWINTDYEIQIYEIGCKYGELRNILNNNIDNFSYRGVEIDFDTLKKIKPYNPNEFICSDVNEGVPFDDKSADYIICLEIMEHIENPTFFLEEIKRVLKKNGKLILSVPNPYCWNELIANLTKKKDDQGHIASFTYQNISALLDFSGLKIYDEIGSFTRIPFSRKLFGRPLLIKTSLFFLSRNNIYLIGD